MEYPKFIVPNQKENSISIQRVKAYGININLSFVVIGLVKQNCKICGFGAQKNHLNETVLYSTQNICFGR